MDGVCCVNENINPLKGLFANENISSVLIKGLRANRYNVSGVKEKKMERISGVSVLQKCFTSGDDFAA